MLRSFVIIIAFVLPLFLSAQTLENQKCGFQYLQQQQEIKSPDYHQEVQHYLQNILPQLSESAESRDLPPIISIPVVVHVIHFGEAVGVGRNISDSQILSQINILNEDFSRMNADAAQTPAAFQGVAADTEISFCLAQTTPNGNPTSGITRHQYNSIPSIEYIEDVIKPETTWDSNNYMNIWSISLPNPSLLGYSYLPTFSMVGSDLDGVVLHYTRFGFISPTNRGRTAVHEIGHYLGLPHIWGNNDTDGNPIGCTSDDGIGDTPNAAFSYFGCPSSGSSCGSNDMYMNFMDYVDDHCMNLFTQGQKNVMRSVLNDIRSNLKGNGFSQCDDNCFDITSNDLTMGFESTEPSGGWQIENTNGDNSSWQLLLETNNDWGPNNGEGLAVYFWNNDGSTPADDYLFTPCFEIKDNHAYQLSFTYACAKAESVVYPEKLEVGFSDTQSSDDFYILGSNWTLDPIDNAYPLYEEKTLNFLSNANSTISIGFHAISEADQYALQIDNIKIEDLGLIDADHEVKNASDISIFPNPNQGVFTVSIELEKPEKKLEISLYDMLGNLIETRLVSDVSHEQILFDLSQKAAGMYIFFAKGVNIHLSQKVMVSK